MPNLPNLRKYFDNKKHLPKSLAILVILGLIIGIAAILISIPLSLDIIRRADDIFQKERAEGAGLQASLTLAVNGVQQPNVPFYASILLKTDSVFIRGVDVIIDYDPTILELLDVVPVAWTSTTLKTFLPAKSDGTFDNLKVVNNAKVGNQGKYQIKFSALTFDPKNKTVESAYSGVVQLATLKFKPIKLGTTIVSFNSTSSSTTDTNIVPAVNPPYDLLSQPSQLVSVSVTVVSPTATSTITSIPTAVPTSSLQPTPTSSVESQNLLTDPGFENNGAGWQKTTFGGRSIVSTQAHSGTKSQQHITHAQYPREVYQDVSITSGLEYAFSGWIKTNNISGGSFISVQWLTESVPLSQSPSESQLVREDIIGTVTGSTNWSNLAKGLLAPPDARIARFRLFSKTQNSEAAAWFDDLSIIKR